MPPTRSPLWSSAEAPGPSGAMEQTTAFLCRFLQAAARLPALASGAGPLPSVPLPLALLLPGHSRPLRPPGFCPGLRPSGWLWSRGLAGQLRRIHSTCTHRCLRGSSCLVWVDSRRRLKERSRSLQKGQSSPTADDSAQSCSPGPPSPVLCPPVPYRLEADEITVPLCFRVNDAPFLLLSLEN